MAQEFLVWKMFAYQFSINGAYISSNFKTTAEFSGLWTLKAKDDGIDKSNIP